MTLTQTQLRTMAKRLINREREAIYGESTSADERLSVIERMIVEEEKRVNGNDSEKAGSK